MHLVHIVPSLEERHGGPSKSVRAVANALTGLGEDVDLLATAPAGTPSPTAGDAARLQVFPRVAPQALCRSPGLARQLASLSADCFHHHSLWLLTLGYAADAARRTGAPLVISPRGMMSDWAWAHHRWRKQAAAILLHPGALTRAHGWHATSREEEADIRRRGFTQPVCVAPNGVTLPAADAQAAARQAWLALCPEAASRPVALFYSRFHRKKRVRELIDLWCSAPRGDWLLLVAGSADEFDAATLAAEVAASGRADRVIVRDALGQPAPYAIASLFLLPSHSENFGLVIAEALASGVPALVTDGTPWSGLAGTQAGWCVPWDAYPRALAEALTQSAGDLQARGRRGRDWMARDYSWEGAARRLRDFYQHLHA